MSLTSLAADDDALVMAWSFPAPVHTVWTCLTDPTLLTRWLGRPIECDVRVGGAIMVDHGEGYLSRSVVSEVEPQHRVVMSWEFPAEPPSRLGITLRPSGEGTAMELAHDGLGDLVAAYAPGWATHLTFLEATIAGASIPPGAVLATARQFCRTLGAADSPQGNVRRNPPGLTAADSVAGA